MLNYNKMITTLPSSNNIIKRVELPVFWFHSHVIEFSTNCNVSNISSIYQQHNNMKNNSAQPYLLSPVPLSLQFKK